jgi:hypothetical protein
VKRGGEVNLDFNQGGMPPASPVNPQQPQPEQSMPEANPVSDETSSPVNNLDTKPLVVDSPTPPPPPPPVPPMPAQPEDVEPEPQTIVTPSDTPKHSILPILLLVLILLILMAAGGWYYYIQAKNNTPLNTDTISLDPSTGKVVDSTQSKDTATKDTTVSTDVTTVAGRDAKRKSDLATIKTYLEKYKTANGSYPVTQAVVNLGESNDVVNALVPTYATALPTDPNTPTYYYGYSSDGASFKLTARLEDTTDPAGATVGNYYLYTVVNSSSDSSADNSSGASDTSSISNDFSSTDLNATN